MIKELFFSFFKIGVLGFGGGSAVAPLIHKETVEQKKWITEEEFIDIVAVSNSLPGPSMPQMAAAVGYKMYGIIGSIIAVLSIILPMSIVFSFTMTILIKYIGADALEAITAPALIVIAALMMSLTKKFFINAKKEMKIFSILVISLIMSLLMIKFNMHPSIGIIFVIVCTFIFTRGDKHD